MRLLALPQDWRYGVLELGQQICREEMPEKRRLRALEKSGVDNNSASMDIAVCDMEKGA